MFAFMLCFSKAENSAEVSRGSWRLPPTGLCGRELFLRKTGGRRRTGGLQIAIDARGFRGMGGMNGKGVSWLWAEGSWRLGEGIGDLEMMDAGGFLDGFCLLEILYIGKLILNF